MSFDPSKREGTVILNISTVSVDDAHEAIRHLTTVYDSGLGMGRLVALGVEGEHVGGFHVPEGLVAIGTVCSVSINGIFLRANIATTSRFGGLLELVDGVPKRFTQIIHYDGTSLDPLEIFIRGFMTSVKKAATTGNGILGASFREVPTIALAEVKRLARQSEKAGTGGVLAIGRPNQPLLDIPVAMGRTGLVVCGGLNPVAAIVESDISMTSAAMHSLCGLDELFDYTELQDRLRRRSGTK